MYNMENVIETIKDIIQKEKEKVNIHLKSSLNPSIFKFAIILYPPFIIHI